MPIADFVLIHKTTFKRCSSCSHYGLQRMCQGAQKCAISRKKFQYFLVHLSSISQIPPHWRCKPIFHSPHIPSDSRSSTHTAPSRLQQAWH